MSSPTVSAPQIATAVGILASGVCTGHMLSISLVTVPAMFAGARAPDNAVILRAFSITYNRGRDVAVPLVLTSSGALAYSAYAARSSLLGTAAALCASVLPWTLLAMKGNINVLLRAEANSDEREKLGMDATVQRIVFWAKQHWLRVVLEGTACVLATYAALGLKED
ncbi:hypothetical protein K488DRAFT_69857 [Vararia minispora EC-137]|uniref:Uncharacterized protein n=1 Tax=Vararia minispora EC-137 TaxID=1314806 RepID=A0ACB8QNK2_9AGAM|nr:hypothetical protein K488DRAFT_69857 [Vararia minispora EC-137]